MAARWRIATLVTLACAVAATLVGTTQQAAGDPWAAAAGSGRDDAPATGRPDADELARLAVLRRPANAADRAALAAVRRSGTVDTFFHGVRERYVRVVGGGRGSGAPVLVPVETATKLTAGVEVYADPWRDLCLQLGGGGSGAGVACESIDALVSGHVTLSRGRTLAVLVPDGVRRVDVELSGGARASAPARDNAAVFRLSARQVPPTAVPIVVAMRWTGARGRVVGPRPTSTRMQRYMRETGMRPYRRWTQRSH